MSERFASTVDGAKIKAERAKCDVNGDQIDTTYAKKTEVPDAQIQADWEEGDTSSMAYIQNKPTIPDPQVQANWNQSDSSAVDYIRNKPSIPAAQVQSNWNETNTSSKAFIQNKPNLHSVATSGDYDELENKPHIPEDPVQSDWNESDNTAQSYIQNKPSLATVATTGSYTDLLNKPNIVKGKCHRLLKYASSTVLYDLDTVNTNTESGYAEVLYTDIATWHRNGETFILYETDSNGILDNALVYTLKDYELDGNDFPIVKFNCIYEGVSSTKLVVVTYIKETSGALNRMVMDGQPAEKTITTDDKLATVATTGDYNDLSNTPTIPTQAQADWNESDNSEPSFIQNKPDLSVYAEATDIKDTEISVKVEGAAAAFDSFTLNQSSTKTIEIPAATAGATAALSTPGAMSAADKFKLNGIGNVFLDATASGATDESVLAACVDKEDPNKTYFIKEAVVFIDDEHPDTIISLDRYNIYKYDLSKVVDPTGSFPDNSKYVLVDAASYSAAEIDALLTEEVTEAVDTIKSRILYTMDLGAVRGREQFPGVNQPYCFFTLFSPSMSMNINTNTNIVFGMTDAGQFDSNTFMYIAFYEVDMAHGRMNWIANTSNIADMSDCNTTGVKHLKLHDVAIPFGKESVELRSDKLYYAAIITNKNSIKLLGSHLDGQINCTPSVGRQIQSHYSSSDYTVDRIKTLDGSFGLNDGNELTNTVFVAITNISMTSSEPAAAPFDLVTSFSLVPRHSNEWLGSSADQDEVFQDISPDNNCTITSWSIIDNIPSPSNKTLGKVFTTNFFVVHEDNDPDNPTGTVTTEQIGTNMYRHTYTPNTPITLESSGTYHFPAASYIDPTSQDVILYQYNGHVGRTIIFYKGTFPTEFQSTNNNYPYGCYLYLTGFYEDNGDTVTFECAV